MGKRVEFLGLIDALNPAWRRAVTPLDAARARRAQLTEKSRYHGAALREMSMSAGLRYLARRGSAFVGRSGELVGAKVGSRALTSHHLRLAAGHVAKPVDAHAFVVRVLGPTTARG